MKKTTLLLIFILISNLLMAQVENKNVNPANLGTGQITRDDSILILLMFRNANLVPDSIIHSLDSFLILTLGKDSFDNFKSKIRVWDYNANGEVIGGSHYNKGKPKKPKSITLLDSLTNHKYVLEKDYIWITAYDDNKKMMWKTDPYIDNRIQEYRTKRPRIIQFRLGKSPNYLPKKIKPGITVIWITYNNTQYGFIDLETGKYYYCGQD